MAPVMALAMAPVMAGEMTYHSTPLHSTQIRVLDALVKVRSTLAESGWISSPNRLVGMRASALTEV